MRARVRGTGVAPLRAAACALLAGGLAASVAAEPYSVPVNRLACSEELPCPPELQRRVDFWVTVFAEHGADTLILHDSDQPERVFAVLKTDADCSRRRPPAVVTAERKRIQGVLRKLASEWGQDAATRWTDEERHVAELFRGTGPAELRAAAGRIRCQDGNRDRFLEGLQRYGAYRDVVVAALQEASLPTDLQFLPFVESSYDPMARSRVGAAGLWQIMPRTGRLLGLRIDASVDERLDPAQASRAAARYLADSRDSLTALARKRKPDAAHPEVNPFVVTSYNYGVGGMARALRQFGPDFVQVLERYRGRSFQVAVKNFYASFLAARHVALNAHAYFGAVAVHPPLSEHRVDLPRANSARRVAEHFGVPQETLEELNPALSSQVWRGRRLIPAGYPLRLPVRSGGWEAQVAALGELGAEAIELTGSEYRVEPGDTACAVARRHGVSCQDLIAENGLGPRAVIRVGQLLAIPGGVAAAASGSAAAASATGGEYQVRPGDSPCGIARRHGVSCGALLAANGLSQSSTIHPGQTLTVPGSSASADYLVRRGDTPCGIARRHGVSCDALLDANGLGRRSTIHPGQTLTIPVGD